MPEEQPNEIEVNLPVKQPGEVKFMSATAFSNPAPDKLKRVLTAIRYTLVGVITMISGSDIFTGGQAKLLSFCLGIAILVCGGIELGTGVKPLPDDNK